LFKVYIFHFVLDIFAYYINFSVVFQTGKEGINYAGTCSDNLDNNCNGLTDDEDDACDAEVSLSVTNGNNLCNYQTQSFTINLRNRENVGIGEVSVSDRIYNSNNNLEYTGSAHCENVLGNGICSNSYNVNLDTGSYYHNVAATYGNNEQITKNNYQAFTVLSNDNVACCADEGEIPTGGRICCNNLPTDGANGACGCPDGFYWVNGVCVYRGQSCSNTCTIQELLTNPEQCLRFTPTPYEQACCFDVNYNDQDFYQWANVEVY